MTPVELRDPADARRFVVQGLWAQGVAQPIPGTVRPILSWALALAADGLPIPPVGILADLGHAAFADDRSARPNVAVPGWPAGLARAYEDHVLGKVFADWSFERAADALRPYPPNLQPRGLAFVALRIAERLGTGGVVLPPANVRSLSSAEPDAVLGEGFESLTRDGPMPLLVNQYEAWVAGARRTADLLAPEDVTALEHRTAVAELGQYVAHRQILLAAARIAARFPARPVSPYPGRKEVPTRVTDEDVYPVGGYSSVSNKGSIESLLHSQLAYIDPDDRPDLFDVKHARDELLYYARDENEFLRRRRAFAVVFDPGLIAARFKDPDLPLQRIVLVQAVVYAVVTALLAWLSGDALRFELLFPADEGKNPLAPEAELFAVLFREAIARGEVAVRSTDAAEARLAELAQAHQTHALWIGPERTSVESDRITVTQLVVAGPAPVLVDARGGSVPLDAETPDDAWGEAALTLLQLWI
jgi:hypothetical protein